MAASTAAYLTFFNKHFLNIELNKRLAMTANLGGWIHNFTVTDTLTHKRGYTIYKITSVIFPRSVPQALTCITVWKRFHDIKRLHRDLCRRQKLLQLSGQIPEPTDSSFFKRFDAGIIQKRRQYILQLLDFVAQHPALYKCHAFSQFFSCGQSPGTSPNHSIMPCTLREFEEADDKSAIAEICDNLDMLYDHHQQLSLIDPQCLDNNSEDDKNADNIDEPSKINNKEVAEIREQKSLCKDYSRFLTPMASIESEDSDYIYEAALEFSKAVQAEANLEYNKAHEKYKRGVEVLLEGSKDDINDERKFIAKAKISKYLSRADDIYDKFIRDEQKSNKTNFQLSIDVKDGNSPSAAALYLEHPWNHLTKYKVLRILGERVMQVQCITTPLRSTYVMKGIEKPSSNSSTQTVFLPQCVPYMVDLLAFFQSEQKIFLLLKQAEGGRLYDYVLNYKPQAARPANLNQIFPEVKDTEETDSGALSLQDSEFINASPSSAEPTSETNFSDLVRCSQQLLKSVSNTLKESENLKESDTKVTKNISEQLTQTVKECSQNMHLITLPEACIKQWARELAVAIHCLHGKGIIMGDLHGDNLLLGNKGQLLLTYFYQNEGWDSDNYVHKALSPWALAGHYVAPERPLTTKSDWWSYGIILYNLLLGLSFKDAHPGHIDLYGCVQYPEKAIISENARDLLDNLLRPLPEERLNYEDIQSHPFFKGTDWEKVLNESFNT